MDFLQMAKEIEAEMIDLRRHLHKMPELSFQEYETSRFITQFLKAHGVEVTTGIAQTGVVGLIRGSRPGKTVALRADMDALPITENTGLEFTSRHPQVMHACGHDIHTAILLGSAKLLSKHRDAIKGNVKLLFQPAEEKLAGAKKMIDEGVLEHPTVDAIIALHCWPELPVGTIGIREELMAASDSLEIIINGTAGHAAHPHKCVDPIVISSHIVMALQTIVSREVAPVDSAVVTIGEIHGGTAPNIIAPNVKLSGTVRTINPQLRERMPEIIERIVHKAAESMSANAEVFYTFGPPPLINDELVLSCVSSAAADLIGSDNVIHLKAPSMGSEDFSCYLEKIPGAMFRLGTANEKPQSQFALHDSRLIFDERSLVTGMAVMCEASLRYLRA